MPTTTSQPDPIQAEASGLDTVTAAFAGREWRVPLDVDTWPLERIRVCVGVRRGETVVDHLALADSLALILGDQWDDFILAAPKRKSLVPASNAFAAAVGLSGTEPDDKAFGGLPRLLAVLKSWPTAVESDLNRFWQIDYRDRFRFQAGRRRLTLRQIYARISHLPADSAVAVKLGRYSPTDLLLMDIYEPLARRAHPARPLTPAQIAERRAEAEAYRKAREAYEARRVAQGHRRIDAGLAAARENASRRKGN